MKYLIFLLITFPVFGRELPPMDPTEPVYQTAPLMPDFLVRTHPGMQQVQPLTAEELKTAWEDDFNRANKRKMWDRGFILLQIGLVMTIAGFVLSRVLAQYAGQLIAHMMSPVGIVLGAVGAFLMEAAGNWWILGVSSFILVAYIVYSIMMKDRGLEVVRKGRLVKIRRKLIAKLSDE